MVCHHCQNYTEQLHQNRPILVRDLPLFGRPVYLKVPRRQFYCPNCQRYPTEKVDFLDIKRRHTQRYEQNIYERVKHRVSASNLVSNVTDTKKRVPYYSCPVCPRDSIITLKLSRK
ncbi:transposase family protein [Microcoleus sp. S13_C3]